MAEISTWQKGVLKSKTKERKGKMSVYGQGLSERKKLILKAVVEAHIEGGEPVTQ